MLVLELLGAAASLVQIRAFDLAPLSFLAVNA